LSMFAKMSSWKKHLLLGLIFFALSLVYYFPAQLAWSLLPKEKAARITLYGLDGPWHSGTAASGQVLGVPVRNISWQLRPTPFSPLRGKISVSLAESGSVQGRIRTGWQGLKGRVAFTAVQAELPLVHFAGYLRRRGLAVDGRLALHLPRLEFADGVLVRAEGEGRVLDVRSLQPVVVGLGDFLGEFSSSAQGVRCAFQDRGGPLAASGVLAMQLDRTYNFAAEFAPRDPGNRDLIRVLAFLAQPDSDGSTRISAAGALDWAFP